MSRIALVFLLLTVVAGGGPFAAPASTQELEIGVWGGYARSNQVTTDVVICVLDSCGQSVVHPHFWRNAPLAGLMLRQQRSERLALRGELVLAQKGYGPGDERSDWRVASRYLEFPLLAEVRLLRLGALRLQASGGLAPALLLSCQVSGTTVDGFVSARCGERDPTTDESYGPSVSYDLGWVLAPGLRLPTSYGQLLLEVRHTRGLVDILPDRDSHTGNHSTAIALATTWRLRAPR